MASLSPHREERLAKNEATFRAVNENILDLASALGGDEPFEFICECSTAGCFERIAMTLTEYERIRAVGTHFLLAPSHEETEIERVVAVSDGYIVVEKHGVAGLVAQEADPRS